MKYPDLSTAFIHPSHNPTTMDKTILMHREARRSGAAYRLQANGLSCHLHANGVIGGDENGAGGHAVLPVEEGPQHSAEHTTSECGNPSAGPHLVHQVHLHDAQSDMPDVRAPPPPLSFGTQTLSRPFKYKLVSLAC